MGILKHAFERVTEIYELQIIFGSISHELYLIIQNIYTQNTPKADERSTGSCGFYILCGHGQTLSFLKTDIDFTARCLN